MSATDKYFQFPIAALQHRKPIDQVTAEEMKARLNQIVEYCVIDVGTAIVERNTDEAVAEQCERYAERYSLKHDKRYKHQSVWLCGADTLGLMVGHVENSSGKESWKAINKLQGGRKQVRIKATYLWEGINGEWSWRDLTTLCGVYAGIGASKMVKLSFDYIAIMAMGYSSRLELNNAGQSENVLDRRKTGYTVRNLGSRGFFASVSPNFRHVYYSHSMDLMTLANALVAKERDKAKPTAKDVTKAIMARTEKPKSPDSVSGDKPRQGDTLSPSNKTSKSAKTELDLELARQKFQAQLTGLES